MALHAYHVPPGKRRRAALLLGALAVLAAVCLTAIPVGIREEALGPAELARDPAYAALRAQMDAIAAPCEAQGPAGVVYWGEVRAVRWRPLLGRDRTSFFVPYLIASVRDVGTAGSADWSFRLEFLSCEYRDGVLSDGRAPWRFPSPPPSPTKTM